MDQLHIELMAAQRRADIRKEMEQIRLEEEALKTTPASPAWFTRKMFGLADWMISTGSRLRRHYEIPARPRTRAASAAR